MASRRHHALSWLLTVPMALVLGCSGGGDGTSGAGGMAGPTGSGGGPVIPGGSPGSDPVTSVEACKSCHSAGQVAPVGDIRLTSDAHAIDTHPAGPRTASGYRRIDATLTQVDVTGSSVVIDFVAMDELGMGVTDLRASDGRFAIARIDAAMDGDPSEWVGIGNGLTESFENGAFENLEAGAYRYTSSYDPTGIVLAGDSLRVAIQLSSSDLPAENAWCDFDADLVGANDCLLGTTQTRDIVQTENCNVCHGPTSETKLSFHGGGRTDVEYCVTCHNPQGVTDFPLLIHKIHAGETLADGFRSYSDVRFPKQLDDCEVCHAGAGDDVDNWKVMPNRVACGSCHDDVNFDTGQNHGAGGVQRTNALCAGCHPSEGPRTTASLPITTVHLGAARFADAATYRGGVNGFAIESLHYSPSTDEVAVVYSVSKNDSRMDLETDPEWAMGGSLSLHLGWDTHEFTNAGSGTTPAQPIRVNALDIGGTVTALGAGRYEALITPPASASNTLAVLMDGRPVTDLNGDGTLADRTPVASVIEFVDIEGGRSSTDPRRVVVDSAKCNTCHDSGGAGLSIHGANRVTNLQVCSLCHNPDATDINRRPSDPTTTPDLKREETIDFKRMIHQIHSGSALQDGVVIYGFGGSVNDFGTGSFVGNLTNCETCHLPGTYSTEDASATAPSTIHTGADIADSGDDLNISSTAAACSSCHDSTLAQEHMKLYGAAFEALDANIR